MKAELKPFWSKFFKFDWKFGLFLLLVICVPRFLMVLQANQTGNYGPIGVIMVVSALVPFIFLNKTARNKIGFRGSKKWSALALALGVGAAFSFLLYFLGQELYGNSFQNWYEYIGKSYQIPDVISAEDKLFLFSIMASTGMIFSPIGEELFFRGIVHGAFAKSVGEKNASLIDSSAFALTHIAHFGLLHIDGRWYFYSIPTLIWVLGMFVVSLIFFRMKTSSDSLWGPIICHAGFNLGMIYSIFYLL
ncbi:CPBP family intramembrane metalloprotease [Zobellia uliginosa]|nr:CPBP family intramembrane metalloprotease [Zobellia uliginosa]